MEMSFGASDLVEFSTGNSFSSKKSAPESCEESITSLVLPFGIFLPKNFVVVGAEVDDSRWVRRNASGSFDEANWELSVMRGALRRVSCWLVISSD